jgi:hypothetical protein
MTGVVLDLMAFADIGAQPRKTAWEIHRQLREQSGGQVVLPVPLEAIAAAAGIEEIQELETDGFEGAMVASEDRSRGAIVLRKGLVAGRRRFTLGHEIGHFLNPYHKAPPGGFKCDKAGIDVRRSAAKVWTDRSPAERMEIEANEFSAAVLVPVAEYRADRANLVGSDIGHLEPLRRKYGVSREFMAQVYVETSAELIAILVSQSGKLGRFILPPKFPYLGLSKGRPLPSRSISSSFSKTALAGAQTELREVEADVWLDRSPHGRSVFEQAVALSSGWMMTLLMIEDPEVDDEDAEDVERNWSAPRFR